MRSNDAYIFTKGLLVGAIITGVIGSVGMFGLKHEYDENYVPKSVLKAASLAVLEDYKRSHEPDTLMHVISFIDEVNNNTDEFVGRVIVGDSTTEILIDNVKFSIDTLETK